MLSLPLPLRQIAGRHASPFRSVDDTWHRNVFGRVNTAALGLSCLFGNDELVEFERTVLIITSVSKNCCKTLLDQLLGDVAKAVISMLLKYVMNLVIDKLVLVAITDGYAFSFFKISFLGLDVVDVNIDIFSDQPLSQESCEKGSAKRLFFFLGFYRSHILLGFIGPIGLLGIYAPIIYSAPTSRLFVSKSSLGTSDGGQLDSSFLSPFALFNDAHLI